MGYTSAGGRLVREKFKIDADAPYVHPQTNKRVHPTSLDTATSVALKAAKENHGKAPAARKLTERQRSLINANQAFIRFQESLRGVHRGNIDKTLAQLGAFAPALSRTRHDLATLAWLGSEFAENLLATIYRDKKNAKADPTQEQEISAAFTRQALTLLKDNSLQPAAFNALLAGFAAGMRGLSGDKITQSSSNPNGKSRTAERHQLADPDVSQSANAGLNGVLQAAKAGETTATIAAAEIAIQKARTVDTLPELMDWIRSGGAASTATHQPGKRSPEPVTTAPLTTRSIQAKGESKTEISTPQNEQPPLRASETRQERASFPSSVTGSTNIPEIDTLTKEVQRLASEIEAIRAQLGIVNPRDGKSSQEYASLLRAFEGLQEQLRILNQRLEELTKFRPSGLTPPQSESKSARTDFATQTIWNDKTDDVPVQTSSSSQVQAGDLSAATQTEQELASTSTQVPRLVISTDLQADRQAIADRKADEPTELVPAVEGVAATPFTVDTSAESIAIQPDFDPLNDPSQFASLTAGLTDKDPFSEDEVESHGNSFIEHLDSDDGASGHSVTGDTQTQVIAENPGQEPTVVEPPSNTSTPIPPLSTAPSAQQILEDKLLIEIATLQAKVDEEQASFVADAAHALRMEAEHQALSERLLWLNTEVEARQQVLDELSAQKPLQPSSPETHAQPTQPVQNASAISSVLHDDKATSSTPRTSTPDRASTASLKRQRPDMPSDDITPQVRSRHHQLVQERAIAAANDEPPPAPEQLAAQPVVVQLDPGAAPAHAGPMPGEQLQAIPVNELPPVAPQAGANPVNENDLPADQLPAAGIDAGSGLTLPRHPADTPRPLISGPAETSHSTSQQSLPEKDSVVFLSTDEIASALNKPTTQEMTREAERVFPDSWSLADDNRLREGEAREHQTPPQTQATSSTSSGGARVSLASGDTQDPGLDTEFPDGMNELRAAIIVPATSSKDPDAQRPQLTIRGGKAPAPFTDTPLTDTRLAEKPIANKPPKDDPAKQPDTRLREAIDATTDFMREALLPAAHKLALVLTRNENVKPETIHQEMGALVDQQSKSLTDFEEGLAQEIVARQLDRATAQRLRQQLTDRVATIQPHLFQEAFVAAGESEKTRLQFASRLFALLANPQATEPRNARTTRFARDMLSDLDTKSSKRSSGLSHWRPQFLQAQEAAQSLNARQPSIGSPFKWLPTQLELTDAAEDDGQAFANRMIEQRPTAARMTRALLTHIDLAIKAHEELATGIAARLPKPEAASDDAGKAQLASEARALQFALGSLEGAVQEAMARSICNGLSSSPRAVREDFARAVLAAGSFLERNAILHGNAPGYLAALRREMGRNALTTSDVWTQAFAAARSPDRKSEAPVSRARPTVDLEALQAREARTDGGPSRLVPPPQAGEAQDEEEDDDLEDSDIFDDTDTDDVDDADAEGGTQAGHSAQTPPAPRNDTTSVPPEPGLSKAEFNQVISEIEASLAQADRILAPPVAPAQTRQPAPVEAHPTGELSSDLPAVTRLMANAARQLEAALQALPVDASGWPDRMATICWGIDAVRYRADHAAAITFDSNRDAVHSMSSSTAGERLGQMLGLDRAAGPIDPDHLGCLLQGVVTHARQPVDVAGLVGGLLGVAHPLHLKALVSAAAAVVQMPDAAFSGQPLVNARANARQLLDLLAARGATAPELAAWTKGNPLPQAGAGMRDTKRNADDTPAFQTTGAPKPPQVSAQAMENPAILLDDPVDEDTEDPWTAHLKQVDSVMRHRLQQRQIQRLGSASQSAEVDHDSSAWRSLGEKIAAKLGLDAVGSARELTTWTRTQTRNLASAMNAILHEVSEDAGLVDLLEGMAGHVTQACMPAFAQASLTTAEGTHARKQQERALKVVGVVFQRLYDRLSADLDKRGQPAASRAARTAIGVIDSLLESRAASGLTSQARLAFSARYSSQRKDAKGAPGDHG